MNEIELVKIAIGYIWTFLLKREEVVINYNSTDINK